MQCCKKHGMPAAVQPTVFQREKIKGRSFKDKQDADIISTVWLLVHRLSKTVHSVT